MNCSVIFGCIQRLSRKANLLVYSSICKITIFALIGKITQNKFNNNYIVVLLLCISRHSRGDMPVLSLNILYSWLRDEKPQYTDIVSLLYSGCSWISRCASAKRMPDSHTRNVEPSCWSKYWLSRMRDIRVCWASLLMLADVSRNPPSATHCASISLICSACCADTVVGSSFMIFWLMLSVAVLLASSSSRTSFTEAILKPSATKLETNRNIASNMSGPTTNNAGRHVMAKIIDSANIHSIL